MESLFKDLLGNLFKQKPTTHKMEIMTIKVEKQSLFDNTLSFNFNTTQNILNSEMVSILKSTRKNLDKKIKKYEELVREENKK